MKTKVTTLRLTTVLAGVAAFLFAAASAHAASDVSDTSEAALPQGQTLLVLTLALLGVLVLMERLCSRQLAVRHRRAAAPAPSLRDALPFEPTVLAAPSAADFL